MKPLKNADTQKHKKEVWSTWIHYCMTESHCNGTKRQSRCSTWCFTVETIKVNAVGWAREPFLSIEGTKCKGFFQQTPVLCHRCQTQANIIRQVKRDEKQRWTVHQNLLLLVFDPAYQSFVLSLFSVSLG